MPQHCQCSHLVFAHTKSVGGCDFCTCTHVTVCEVCGGNGFVAAAPVTGLPDWGQARVVDCPKCGQP